MAEFVCKFADANGRVLQEIESAPTEKDLRDRFAQRGLLLYSVKPRRKAADWSLGDVTPAKKKLNLDQFIIFNQQFVTLHRAGLPIVKSLELLAKNTKNKRLAGYIQDIHADVKTGTPLSQAFLKQQAFPPIYTTSLMAGEKSGALADVIERYVTYQRLALGVRKKILVSLIYPTVLICLVILLVGFLVTYVVPEFASLYDTLNSTLPRPTEILVAIGSAISDNLYAVGGGTLLVVALVFLWSRTSAAKEGIEKAILRTPVIGTIWIKYQVAQLCRLMSTILDGGIPLMQALDTTSQSLDSRLIRDTLKSARAGVREGRPLSEGLAEAGIFPSLAIEMIQVGESTGALPGMLNSVAEFFDEDVSTQVSALLSLIEPAIMIFMGIFVAFVLISLYLPIFSLAEGL